MPTPLPITADRLRLGMFVHLNVGWMAHSFALSSFKIVSEEQLASIRALGLSRLTWSPERSDPAPTAAPTEACAGPTDAASASAQAQDVTLACVSPTAPAPPPVQTLDAQVAAMQICEQQFGLACRDARAIHERALTHPEQAGDGARALADSLIHKMLCAGTANVRVLGEPASDRLSAHGVNVAVLSLLLGQQLGLDTHTLADVGVGALLHDVGKLDMPYRVRELRADFSVQELAAHRSHVERGLQLGRRMNLAPGALLAIAQHHEYADASGYPQAVRGEQISLQGQIVALVNAFDGLCQGKPGVAPMTPHDALSTLFALHQGKHQAHLLASLIRLLGIYPPGSVVQLSDDRYAIVMAVCPARPLKPTVLVYQAGGHPAQAPHLDLSTAPQLSVRRSLKPQQLPPLVAQYLAPRRRIAYFFDADAPQPGDLAGVAL